MKVSAVFAVAIASVATVPVPILGFVSTAMGTIRRASDYAPSPRATADDGAAEDKHPAAAPFRIGYVTDVEGNYDYFRSFVERSSVLDVLNPEDADDDASFMELSLKDDGCRFVYGGDAVDKGPGDIRLCRSLVSLKRRHPDRVHLLVGNRDLNKLRFAAELSDADMARDIDEIPPPHWDPKAPTLRTYLEKVAADWGLETAEDADTRAERLRYMLLHTLGCPDTFEFRREELGILRGTLAGAVTDDDVVESFLHETMHPEGSLRQYLDCADVVAVVGNTLFAHGAVDSRTAGFVPRDDSKFENPRSEPPPGRICAGVREWADEMNAFLRRGLRDFDGRPLWDGRTTRGGEALIALQNRSAMWGRSVVSNCYGDGGCIATDHAARRRDEALRRAEETADPLAFEGINSDPTDPEVASWLLRDGIRRVVVGHKPTGDCPAVLSASHMGVEVVSADTSFSDIGAKDNRGMAVTVVEIAGDGPQDNRLEVSGRLRDGTDHRSVFGRLHEGGLDDTVGDAGLGTQLPGGWWIKAATPPHYRLCRGRGRNVEYGSVHMSQIVALRSTSRTIPIDAPLK